MLSFGLNSTNLNGPVPIGCCRMSRVGHGRDRPACSRRHQGEDRRLRAFQHESDFRGAAGVDFRDVVLPRFARVEAQPLGGAGDQQIPGAFDVGRGEGPPSRPLTPCRNLKISRVPLSSQDPALGSRKPGPREPGCAPHLGSARKRADPDLSSQAGRGNGCAADSFTIWQLLSVCGLQEGASRCGPPN
jgi:hypothetical protein